MDSDELMLRELDGMQQRFGQTSEGGSGFGFDLAMSDVGQEAGNGRAEIVGRDAISREEER